MNKITKASLGLVMGLVFFLFVAFAPQPKKYRLELNLKKGDVFRMEVLSEQDIVQNIEGMEQKTKQSMLFEYVYEVLDVKDDIYLTQITYERVKTDMMSPGMDQTYDSANPPEEISPSLKGVAMLVGKSFTLEFKKDGEVLKLEGLDAIFNTMLDSLDIADETMKETFAEQMRSQFGDEAMKKSMEGMHRIYPEKPVAIGESWKRTLNISSGPVPMQVQNEWTLLAVEGNEAVIGIKSKVLPIDGAKPLEMMNLSIRYEIEGSQEGNIRLQMENGWTNESVINQKMGGEVEMSGMLKLGAPEDTKRWPISFVSTYSIRQLK